MRNKQQTAEALIARHKYLKTSSDFRIPDAAMDTELYNLLEELQAIFEKPVRSAAEKEEEMRRLAAQQSVQ